MGEKIFSKFSMKDYRNELEIILDSKQFDDEAKSFILSIFYKLDNFYKDYLKIKKDSQIKSKFLEEYIKIIKDKCNKIEIVAPKENTQKYIVNKEKGEIRCFPNELILLTAIYELNEKSLRIADNRIEEFFNVCLIELINKANTINSTEPIRDFNGWSWNIELENQKNIEYNLVFQNLLILFGYDFIIENCGEKEINKIIENKVKEEYGKVGEDFLEKLIELSILMYNNDTIQKHKTCVKVKEVLINKKNNVIEKEKIDKENINQEELIEKKLIKINRLLNDIKLVRLEYKKYIDKFKSLSDFISYLEKNKDKLLLKKELIKELKNDNLYINEVDEYNKILKYYEDITGQDDNVKILKKIMILQLKFLQCIKIKINKIENKKELYNILVRLRYYANCLYMKKKSIMYNEKIWNSFENVIEELIYKMLENKVIDIGFKSKKLNYQIFKHIFKMQSIDLDNIILKIDFIDNKKIEIRYLDDGLLEYREKIEIPFEEEISNTKSKRVKLLKMGG
ncbi:MAG: hypothetical protein E7313_01910 [Clostridiales bacterium]|nr:hypothetical protein [Clostridiales bacterium]